MQSNTHYEKHVEIVKDSAAPLASTTTGITTASAPLATTGLAPTTTVGATPIMATTAPIAATTPIIDPVAAEAERLRLEEEARLAAMQKEQRRAERKAKLHQKSQDAKMRTEGAVSQVGHGISAVGSDIGAAVRDTFHAVGGAVSSLGHRGGVPAGTVGTAGATGVVEPLPASIVTAHEPLPVTSAVSTTQPIVQQHQFTDIKSDSHSASTFGSADQHLHSTEASPSQRS
jgi:hypothetical protein